MPRAKPKPAPIPSEPANHSPKDVADFLGISLDGVYRLVKSKQITHIPVAGVIRFRRSDVEAYMRRNTVLAGTTAVSGEARERFKIRR